MENNFYRNMLLRAPFGYAYHKIILDSNSQPVDYEFLEINETFEELTGLKAKNILGKTVKEVLPDIDKGEFDWIKYYGEIALNCERREFEQYALPQDKWYRVQAYSDKKYFFSTIFSDITNRKKTELKLSESETRFRLLYENAPIAYQSLDEKGLFLDVNEKWQKTLGFIREEVLGKSFGDFLHPDWKKHFEFNFPKFKELGEVFGVEFKMIKKDGTEMLVSFNGKIGYDDQGNFKQTHCVFTDITEQRKIEQEKVQMQAQLFHSSKLATLGTLAAGVAHEINNPLAIIVGSCDMLQMRMKGNSFQEINQAAEVIKGASDRISTIVKGLKVYARKDAEEVEKVDAHMVISETLLFIKGIFKKENIEIETNLNALRFCLNVNKGKFQQVLVNLINNAKDALSNRDHGKIIISTENKNEQLIIKVSDNGTGIPEKIMTCLFDPFFTTKDPGKGTGLGLSICQSIVETYQGKIQVESKPEEGATFSLIFNHV